ncbi:hypothetical protein BDN72DRAFT_929405 [Pluteus cervinus]|uniref:Uncharacterized protein n=1 Tax=Pluteus cervinus TaxID=181527 RepID=A0ACD3AB94_9AGAR|nr:hypothetical protein BDN72DRAFT_929405 [Pluteus cervinus]
MQRNGREAGGIMTRPVTSAEISVLAVRNLTNIKTEAYITLRPRNLIHTHFRKIFQIDLVAKGGMGNIQGTPLKEKRATSLKDRQAVESCRHIIRDNQPDHQITVNNERIVVGTRHVLAKNIFQWRQQNRNVDPAQLLLLTANLPQSSASHGTDSSFIGDGPISSMTSTSNASTAAGQAVGTDDASNHRHSEAPNLDESALQLPPKIGVDPVLAARVIRHLLNVDSHHKALSQSSKAILTYICDLIGADYGHIDLTKRKIRRPLFDLITNEISTNELAAQKLAEYRGIGQKENRALLGQDVMEAIRLDMKNTQTPSWIDPAPADWGTARRGKLSADHWRVIGTIHVPITLIRLWRTNDPRYRFIEHYMHLVNAVRLANLKVSTPAQIGGYRAYILSYLRGLRLLYPDVKLRPTHHAAYHIYDMLKLFGPVHSHSAPFFERYNHFLQRMNTNRKIGQVESTFMHTSARFSNLKAILQDDGPIRESVIEMVTALDRIQSEDARGSRLASMLDPTSPTNILPMRSDQHGVLSEDEYGLLFNLLTTHPQDMAQDNHLPHQSGTSSYRDSTAIFRPRQAGADPNPRELAGTIQRIFQYSYSMAGQDKQGYFVSIMEHQRITESRGAEADPYPAFGHAAGYLCERAPERLHVLELSQLVSHFVLTYFPEGEWVNYIHILPVDRLMLSFRFEDNSTDDTDLPHEAT